MWLLYACMLGLVLALDAGSVSAVYGSQATPRQLSVAIKLAVWFGGFQALMPLIGGSIGRGLSETLSQYGTWASSGLLCMVGIRLLVSGTPKKPIHLHTSVRSLSAFALATSIDALLAGFSIGISSHNLITTSLVIGLVTGFICVSAYYIGNASRAFLGIWAQRAGGAVLIGLAIINLLS